MNIAPINTLNSQDKQITNKKNLKYNKEFVKQEPITDSVSFKATAKMLKSRANGITLQLAKEIHNEILPAQEKVRKFLSKNFDDMIATTLNPEKPILVIKNRAKSPESIVEKSATRSLYNRQEVLEGLTDLNGAKIVMRDGTKGHVEHVLNRFITLIKNKEVELIEIENKRPSSMINQPEEFSKYDYATEYFLENLKKVQEKVWTKNHVKKTVRFNMSDFTKTNYIAIHFLFKLPNEKRPFELVVLGKNVNSLKDLDDLIFKITNHKNVDPKYKPIADIVEVLNLPANSEQKEAFTKYRGEAFIYQRLKTPREFTNNESEEYFLPLSCDLPQEFDLNYLHQLKKECDAKANSTTEKIKRIGSKVGHVVKNQIKKVLNLGQESNTKA